MSSYFCSKCGKKIKDANSTYVVEGNIYCRVHALQKIFPHVPKKVREAWLTGHEGEWKAKALLEEMGWEVPMNLPEDLAPFRILYALLMSMLNEG